MDVPAPSLITLTPNPALDLTTAVDRMLPGHKLRCGAVRRDPGGGGVNVARMLHRLGASVQAWLLVGGEPGRSVVEALGQEGVPTRTWAMHGSTRENLTVLETATGAEYRLVLPGPDAEPDVWHHCVQALDELASPPRWLIASGGLLPGMPADSYARLLSAQRARGVRVALDCSGAPLAAALAGGVDLVKPSLRELRELLGEPLDTPDAQHAAVRRLIETGRSAVVALSLGDQGAVLATRDGMWRAPALPVPSVQGTTGAGDCFLAALVWALDQDLDPAQALQWGVAAATASLGAPGTALAQVPTVRRLREQVHVQAVHPAP